MSAEVPETNSVDPQGYNNVIITSKRRRDVVLT